MNEYPTCSAVAPGGDPDEPMLCTEGAGHYAEGTWHGCPGPGETFYMWGNADDSPTLIGSFTPDSALSVDPDQQGT